MEHLKFIVERDAKNLEARHGIVRLKSRLVMALAGMGQRKKALALQREAITQVEAMVKTSPENLMFRQSLGTAHAQLAQLHESGKELGLAEANIRKAVALYEKLVEADPGNSQYQRELLVLWAKLGDQRLALDDRETSLHYYERGLKVVELRVKNDPHDAQALTDLLIQHVRLGMHATLDSRPKDGRKHFEKVLELIALMDRQKMTRDATLGIPRTVEIKQYLTLCDKVSKAISDPTYAQKQWLLAQLLLLQRALGLCRQGKHQEAAVAVELLRKQGPNNRSVLFDVARGYGRCAATVLQGKRPDELPTAERKLLEDYRAKALAALERSVERSFADLDRLAADSDLAVLREEAKYRQLVERLKKKRRPAGQSR
jgi:tetratricopeptide (TPR) repeat protein